MKNETNGVYLSITSMKSRLKSVLVDVAIVLGIAGAAIMSLGVAAICGAICALIFGGSIENWTVLFILIDAGLVGWLLKQLIDNYWSDYERQTNL